MLLFRDSNDRALCKTIIVLVNANKDVATAEIIYIVGKS